MGVIARDGLEKEGRRSEKDMLTCPAGVCVCFFGLERVGFGSRIGVVHWWSDAVDR